MTAILFSLVAVTIGFTALVLWVYWPSRKAHFERLAAMALDEDLRDRPGSEERRS
jgi:cbb3-type cytochrome oxidase subunit 3